MIRLLLSFPDGTSIIERFPSDGFEPGDKLPEYLNEHLRPLVTARWGADTEIRSADVRGGPSWFAAA